MQSTFRAVVCPEMEVVPVKQLPTGCGGVEATSWPEDVWPADASVLDAAPVAPVVGVSQIPVNQAAPRPMNRPAAAPKAPARRPIWRRSRALSRSGRPVPAAIGLFAEAFKEPGDAIGIGGCSCCSSHPDAAGAADRAEWAEPVDDPDSAPETPGR